MTERRKRVYTLRFDNGPDQRIEAVGPTEAVAQRAGGREARLPYQINDETAIGEWIAKRQAARAAEGSAL